MPFAIEVYNRHENKIQFWLVSENLDDDDKFYLTDLNSGETWTTDFYRLDFLEHKLLECKWMVVDFKFQIGVRIE